MPRLVAAPADLIAAIDRRVKPTGRQFLGTGMTYTISADDYATMLDLLQEACGIITATAVEARRMDKAMRFAVMPCAGEC